MEPPTKAFRKYLITGSPRYVGPRLRVWISFAYVLAGSLWLLTGEGL